MKFVSLFIVLVSLGTISAQAETTSELIFPLQGQHVHASSVEELPNGDLISVWFQGSGERGADDVRLMGARMKRGASKWSTPFLMADTPDIPDCNPVLYLDAQDRLWLIWIVVQSNRWEHSILKYKRADEPGNSGAPNWNWQDIILLKPGEDLGERLRAGVRATEYDEGMWAEYAPQYSKMLEEAAKDPHKRDTGWMTRTRPITLASGRILIGLYSDGFNTSLVAMSDDQGETWQASAPIIGLAPIQPTLAQRENGDILAYCRDSGPSPGRIMLGISKDDGETWSVAEDTDIPNPGSSVAVTVLNDGRWVMVFNDTERGRHQLAITLSEDEGRTWPWKQYLDRAEHNDIGSYSYPTVMQGKDGRIHVTYSHVTKQGPGPTGAAIKHVALEADSIK